MIRYIVRRLLYAVPILLGVTLATFVLFYAVIPPELMARRNISGKTATPEQIQTWLEQNGYDKPLPEQFRNHVSSLLLLRFGASDRTEEPIWERIREGAPPSLQLGAMTLMTSLVVGLTLATLLAYFRGTYVDTGGTVLCVVGLSVVYVVYVIGMQFLLGKLLQYGPLAGYERGLPSWTFVALPAAIGVFARLGADIRLYRTFLLDEMNQDYVRTARAKGVGETAVLFKHVLKNAMIPVVTTTVAAIPTLILGSLLLETFFGIPGLGSYLTDAIAAQDFSIVRAMTFLGALLYIVGLLLTDILYAVIDPRVKLA